ncbi:MAG TPA: DNA adenine methylase [Acidobacteriaceae bacterium]|nr:DNA adenine methylase [Acidobacteriaceae bacterium]
MNSPFAWPGGKRCLLKTLRARIPTHKIYVEVFAGSAKLLFAKDPSPSEVMNDLNGEVANFFRVVKHRPAELVELLEHEIVHPERFRELRVSAPTDELGRALRFAYTTWYSYGAKGLHFAGAHLTELQRGSARRPLDAVRELLNVTTERLRRVRIEQRDFTELVRRFDTPETFFYLDPPYVHYKANGRYDALPESKRLELFETLAAIEGVFLLSFDNCAEVRELARKHGMFLEAVQTRYALGSTLESRGPVTEVLISNSAEVVDVHAPRIAKEGEELVRPVCFRG